MAHKLWGLYICCEKLSLKELLMENRNFRTFRLFISYRFIDYRLFIDYYRLIIDNL